MFNNASQNFYRYAVFFMTACDSQPSIIEEKDMSSKVISVQLGESGEALVKRLGLDERKNIDRQPLGVNFIKQDFKSGNMPTLRLEHGIYSFEIPNIFGYTVVEPIKKRGPGIDKLRVTWLFNNTSGTAISHDEARLTLMAFIKQLTYLGWRNMLNYSDPRLTEEESYQYRTIDLVYAPDPNYLLDITTWMKLRTSRIWQLHADGMVIEIGFHRNSDYMDPTGNGDYLLLLDAYPIESFARANFEYKVQEKWQGLWVDEIKRLKRIRYQKEAELIKQGYHIDTSYQDPLIHPADPIEPDIEK